MSDVAPVVVVLCAQDGPYPQHLDTLADRVTLRMTDADGLADAVQGAQVLLVWDFFSRAVADVWERCESLRWIHVTAAGVDSLLFDELRDSDVIVTNARDVFNRPIAEYVLGALLADAKRLHESHDLQRERVWRHRETRSLADRHAVVLGIGGIGREIARLLRGLDVRVTGAGRTARAGDQDFDRIVASSDLAAHLADADYLVNAVPLTAATEGLIDVQVLAALPEHAYLVNVGRGETVVEADLVTAIREHRLRGACLDVFATEPLPPDSPLWRLDAVTVTPHMSADTVGWRERLERQFIDLADHYLDGRPLYNVIDKQLGFAAG